MKRNRKWIVLTVVVVIVTIGGFLLWRRLEARGEMEDVRTATVQQGTLRVTVTGSGRIEPWQEIDLSFDLPGRITAVNVEMGDPVRAGDVLATLRATDLERAVTQAELTLRQAELRLERLQEPVDEADVEAAEAAVTDAAIAYQLAQRNLEITENSVSVGDAVRAARYARDEAYRVYQDLQARLDEGAQYVNQSMVDAAHDAYLNALGAYNRAVEGADLQLATANSEVTRVYHAWQQAQDNLARLREGVSAADLEAAQLDVEAARLALERAQGELEKAALVAPFDGVIATVNVAAGEIAPTGLPAFRLVDVTAFRITVSVDEIDVAQLSEGLPVELSVDALPDVLLTGTVGRISPAATFEQGAISYSVVVTLDPSDAALRPGMSATAVIMVDELVGQLLIPNWVVRIDQSTGQTYVYRQTSNGLERADVQLGVRHEGYSQVLAGLQAGDEVVLVQEQNTFFTGQ
ncbi:MAG: efflux RND transporter periplasmic adaptor subunit [Anaerolineae bacterium]|nr:efflux RND transporter periplasmic adaptor subunit [Anaerolineae bacterium]